MDRLPGESNPVTLELWVDGRLLAKTRALWVDGRLLAKHERIGAEKALAVLAKEAHLEEVGDG